MKFAVNVVLVLGIYHSPILLAANLQFYNVTRDVLNLPFPIEIISGPKCAKLLSHNFVAPLPFVWTTSILDIWHERDIRAALSMVFAAYKDRRGWDDPFIDLMWKNFTRYHDQSIYLMALLKPNPVGFLTITFSEFNEASEWMRDHLPAALVRSAFQSLPIESVLPNLKIERKLAGARKGFLIEFRSYYLSSEIVEEAISRMYFAAIRIIKQRLGNGSPQWYDNIIYTYGDETSVRFYRRLGFDLMGDPSPNIDGWRVLATSPDRLGKALLRRYPQIYFEHDRDLMGMGLATRREIGTDRRGF